MTDEGIFLGLKPYSPVANIVGGLAMALSMSLFVLNDTFLRLLLREDNPLGLPTLNLPTIIAVRGVIVVALLIILSLVLRLPVLPRAMVNRWNLARALTEATITLLFVSAMPALPFAVAQTLIQTNPIFLVFLGIVLFREQVSWRRWLAIAVGFGGIILAASAMNDAPNPNAAIPTWLGVLMALGAALLVALRDVFTRYLGAAISPVTVSLTTALATLGLGCVLALFFWQAPSAEQVLVVAGAGICMSGAILTAVVAVRLGVFAVVGPLRFISLVVAFAIGLAFFGDPFSWQGLIGAGLIVGSALWILLRQRIVAKT